MAASKRSSVVLFMLLAVPLYFIMGIAYLHLLELPEQHNNSQQVPQLPMDRLLRKHQKDLETQHKLVQQELAILQPLTKQLRSQLDDLERVRRQMETVAKHVLESQQQQQDDETTPAQSTDTQQEAISNDEIPDPATLPAFSEARKLRLVEQYRQLHGRRAVDPKRIPSTCGHESRAAGFYSTIEYATTASYDLHSIWASLSAASLVAQRLEAGLYSYWGCCDTTDVFQYMVGPNPLLLKNSAVELIQEEQIETFDLQFQGRAVPGFENATTTADCVNNLAHAASYLFDEFAAHYLRKDVIDQYYEANLKDHYVIAVLGIRAEGMALLPSREQIQALAAGALNPNLLVLLTPDSSAYVDRLREELKGVTVLVGRPESPSHDPCLARWDAQVQEQLLLARANIVLDMSGTQAPWSSSPRYCRLDETQAVQCSYQPTDRPCRLKPDATFWAD